MNATLPAWADTLDAAARVRVAQVAVASEFCIDTLTRDASLRAQLMVDDGANSIPPPLLSPDTPQAWAPQLRRWRAAASARLVWRDVLGLDDVDATLAGTTWIAEQALACALAAVEGAFMQRHGQVRDADGNKVRLVVLGLGKLGGAELNFSSDIDLVFAYAAEGESDGARTLPAEQYFARLCQQLAKLLDEVTAEGFCHRVDLRLRPYGHAGRLAWSFAALEQYFLREGRDWERYAWQKARAVTGDVKAGEEFLKRLQPFVYRRYLDYGALDGLRSMKAMIDAEVVRRDLADDIKRGPGGIREIEFLAQALQLIRGGREPALQVRSTRAALQALQTAGHLTTAVTHRLLENYRFLRRLENRLQMLRDAQIHQLPESADDRARIATGLGFETWQGLQAVLEAHRAHVQAEFAQLLAPDSAQAAGEGGEALQAYWAALPEGGNCTVLRQAGYTNPERVDHALRTFARGLGAAAMTPEAALRIHRLMPMLIAAATRAPDAALALERTLALLGNVLRRSSYVALLQESPRALARLLQTLSRSALLGERLAAYPMLLDELLDVRARAEKPAGDAAYGDACHAAAREAHNDPEQLLARLNEVRQSLSFRTALATLDRQQPGVESAAQLAQLAQAVLQEVVQAAHAELVQQQGAVADARFAVLGYGSLGGQELGFGSDLDLVFLYDAPDGAASSGARSLDAARWHARLAQKIVALLQAPTQAGRLYDVDLRLRPDGAKGLLVASVASFRDYQHKRAWVWEHQALVRARCVAEVGAGELCAQFEQLRKSILVQPRDGVRLASDVVEMRQRMRHELDRSTAQVFDLKQGEGGLVDLEFFTQAGVLAQACHHPDVTTPRVTPELLQALHATGWMDAPTCARLVSAHATLVEAGLACTLDRRPRLVVPSHEVETARASIREACAAHDLDFNPAGEAATAT